MLIVPERQPTHIQWGLCIAGNPVRHESQTHGSARKVKCGLGPEHTVGALIKYMRCVCMRRQLTMWEKIKHLDPWDAGHTDSQTRTLPRARIIINITSISINITSIRSSSRSGSTNWVYAKCGHERQFSIWQSTHGAQRNYRKGTRCMHRASV